MSEPRCGVNKKLAVATMDPGVGPATVDRDFIHVSCITVCSEVETFYPSGKLLK